MRSVLLLSAAQPLAAGELLPGRGRVGLCTEKLTRSRLAGGLLLLLLLLLLEGQASGGGPLACRLGLQVKQRGVGLACALLTLLADSQGLGTATPRQTVHPLPRPTWPPHSMDCSRLAAACWMTSSWESAWEPRGASPSTLRVACAVQGGEGVQGGEVVMVGWA